MNNNIRGAKAPVEHLVPNRRLLELLQSLLYHHQTLRKPDPYGVQLYQDAINHYLAYHKLSSGVLGYMLNRIHSKGRWSSYYSKVHVQGHKVKQSFHLVDYFRQKTDELILSGDNFGLDVKEEVKIHIGGSIDGYHDLISNLVYQEQLRILSGLINKMTADSPLRELPKPIRLVLTKAISKYFMALGSDLDHDDLILLRSLFRVHKVPDTYSVF